MSVAEQFVKARNVSVPLILIKTPDPAATIRNIRDAYPAGDVPPLVQWDFARGIGSINDAGAEILKSHIFKGGFNQMETINPVAALSRLVDLPGQTKTTKAPIVFSIFGHRFFENPGYTQAVWNLRDEFKKNMRTLVILAPDVELPAEVAQDILILDEPLPNEEQIREIVQKQARFAKAELPDDVVSAATRAATGLSAFCAEQTTVLSLYRRSKDAPVELDTDRMWKRKREMIEQTPGLSVWQSKNGFDSLGGLRNIKEFCAKLINGKKKFNAVVFQDEIEKMYAGSAGTDTSGVSQGLMGKQLQFMSDYEMTGAILIGFPGCGKSEIGKALGATAGVPTINCSISDMKGSLVGQSEQRFSQALRVINSVSQGNALFIATCNKITNLPPELRRRFTLGTWFFDLCDEEERAAIWEIYKRKYELTGVKGSDMPDDTGWTGAEIRACASLAERLAITPREASEYIVPVCKAMGKEIDTMRDMADGTYISASYSGTYRKPVDVAGTNYDNVRSIGGGW